jgi:hypothetical protein
MTRHITLILAALLAPTLALAQTTPTKDKEAVVFDEVERGFFFGVGYGANYLRPPAPTGTPALPFSSGQMGMVEIGYELAERVALSAYFMGSVNRAGSDYTGFSNGTASGDFSVLVPGAALRLNALGFSDSQGVQRTWLYLRGGGGYAMFSPRTLLPDPDTFLFAGLGVEYFTRLRHFSIGLEASGSYMVTSKSQGFAVAPTVRYSF